MKTARWSVVTAVLFALAAAGQAAAQELMPTRTDSTLVVPKVAAAPRIDGVLDDAVWAKAQPLRDWSYKGKGPAYQTEGYLCRDEENFYLAARCFDDTLDDLVTENQGSALWRNDCIEIFIVPEKKGLFFCHLIVDCAGVTSGGTWVPDEWGEPTKGKGVTLTVKTGREADAWTLEMAIPVAAFGLKLTPQSEWAFGLNREKKTNRGENSSFQGGFNTPREYPTLKFDDRTIVVDGLGVKNIGTRAERVKISVVAGNRQMPWNVVTVEPGKSVPIKWRELVAPRTEGTEFSVEISTPDDKLIVGEKYVLVPAGVKLAPVDVEAIPPANLRKTVLDDPDFFPVSVWLQPAGQAANYKNMGINVFVGGVYTYPRPKGRAFLDALAQQGAYAIAAFNPSYIEDEKINEHPAFLGWMFGDEPDNSDPDTGTVKITPEALLKMFANIRRADPAHRVYLNLGCGVADERFIGGAATDEQYSRYPKACDIIYYDVYPCNSISPDGPDRLHLVAKGIDRLRKWAGPDKMVWMWLEANHFSSDGSGRAPTPDELKTQIWMALVHGADGYGFFCHSFLKATQGVSRIAPEIQAALPAINGEVHRLARVLKSKTLAGAAQVKTTMGSRVDVMVKEQPDALYAFAVNMYRKAEKPTITLKGVGDGEAEVLFEDRTVPVKGGVIVDDFAPYGVHRYRIKK